MCDDTHEGNFVVEKFANTSRKHILKRSNLFQGCLLYYGTTGKRQEGGRFTSSSELYGIEADCIKS
jgi:hypothetical protein